MPICTKCGKEKPEGSFRVRRSKNHTPWREGACRDCLRDYDTVRKRHQRDGDGRLNYRHYMRNYQRQRAAELRFLKMKESTDHGLHCMECLDCGAFVPRHRCGELLDMTLDDAILFHPHCPDCGSQWLVPRTRKEERA